MITLKIPKDSKGIDLEKEIALARNIKDQVNRNNTISGLLAIKRSI